jgi:hypothetical protein
MVVVAVVLIKGAMVFPVHVVRSGMDAVRIVVEWIGVFARVEVAAAVVVVVVV